MEYSLSLKTPMTVLDLADAIRQQYAPGADMQYTADVENGVGVRAGSEYSVHLQGEFPGTKYQRLKEGLARKGLEFVVRPLDADEGALGQALRSLDSPKEKAQDRQDLVLLAIALAAGWLFRK